MVTQREIARRAKTSLKTVSRVINGDPLVNATTRSRIESLISELGYQPHQAARMMRSQKSNIVGFLADGVAISPSSVDLIRGAQDTAWAHGKQMMLFNIERGDASEQHAESQLAAFRAEAVIYATRFHQAVSLPEPGMPRILLNCFGRDSRDRAIVPDDYKLAYDLMTILVERGYRRPVFLNLSPEIVASDLRRDGVTDAARRAGIDMEGRIVPAVEERANGPRFLADRLLPPLFDTTSPPDIIICGQDILAMNVYFVLAGLGKRIGKDIAVASFDNLQPIADLLQPGLSTMELPYYEMGQAAMLAAIGLKDSDAGITRLPGRLIERSSF